MYPYVALTIHKQHRHVYTLFLSLTRHLRNLPISTHRDLPHSSLKLLIIPLDEYTYVESRTFYQALMLCQALWNDRRTLLLEQILLLFLAGLC